MANHTSLLAGLFILASAGLSVGMLLLIVRRYPRIRKPGNNEILMAVFQVVSGLYGLVLAFIVVTSWQGYSDAKRTTNDEIVAVSNVLRNANSFPDAFSARVKSDIRKYAELVVSKEWPKLAEGTFHPDARAAYEQIWDRFYAFEAKTPTEKQFFRAAVDRLNELGAARRLRIYNSQSNIPSLLWVLIFAGGIMQIGLMYMFWVRSVKTQAMIVGIVGGFIAFIILLTYFLQHPFLGDFGLSTQPYEYFIDQLKG